MWGFSIIPPLMVAIVFVFDGAILFSELALKRRGDGKEIC